MQPPDNILIEKYIFDEDIDEDFARMPAVTFFRYIKEMLIAPLQVLRTLYKNRHILFHMVKNEIRGRFAGSVGGVVWNFAHPLMMLVVYLTVFVYIFKLRVGTHAGPGASALFLMAGLFPWIIIAEGILRGTSSLLENANLIQKTAFPTEILTAKAVIAPILSHGVAIAILVGYRVVTGGSPAVILILVPAVVVLQTLFVLGVVFLTSTASVFFRDALQLVNLVVGFWIYLTPILYPVTMLPQWAHKVMYLNPLYPFMSLYHTLLLEGSLGPWHMPTLALLISYGLFMFGSFVFTKLKFEFADWL